MRKIRRASSSVRKVNAFQRGQDAWDNGLSTGDNPYRPIYVEYAAWNRGYVKAAQLKSNPIPNKAPLGIMPDETLSYIRRDTYVVVKRFGASKKVGKTIIKDGTTPELNLNEPINGYLGYLKPGNNGRPRKYRVWTRNPPEDKWQNKVANKSYREENEGE